MEGLQRSSETFRRSGSSGMVWEWDDKHLSGEIKPSAGRRASTDGTAAPRPERSRSVGHAGYRTSAMARRDVSPALDPPSPRVAVCGGCCPFFGGKADKKKKKGQRRR